MISSKIKVFLVEDNHGDIAFTQTLLRNSTVSKQKKISFEVELCHTLREAIEYLRSTYVDIVLLDLNLPDSWGLETFQSLKQIYPDIPIVILSGINDENISLHAIQEGAQEYIIKGEFDDKTLVQAILSALEEIRSDLAQPN